MIPVNEEKVLLKEPIDSGIICNYKIIIQFGFQKFQVRNRILIKLFF